MQKGSGEHDTKWKNVIEELRPFCYPDLDPVKKNCTVFSALPPRRIERICPEFFYKVDFQLPNGSHFYHNNVLYNNHTAKPPRGVVGYLWVRIGWISLVFAKLSLSYPYPSGETNLPI